MDMLVLMLGRKSDTSFRAAFDTAKMRIISDATSHTDFDACVNLFQDFIEQCRAMHTPGHHMMPNLHLSKVRQRYL